MIGSLNGVSNSGWVEYAADIEQAGADALELNTYYIPTNPKMTAADWNRTILIWSKRSNQRSRFRLPSN